MEKTAPSSARPYTTWAIRNQPFQPKHNMCVVAIANATIRQRRPKAIDMRFYWIKTV
jgi:hypothetical protein